MSRDGRSTTDGEKDPSIIVGSAMGLEDAAAERDVETIVITHEDVEQDELRRLFEPALLRTFAGFVSAGLPDMYLREHPELRNDAQRNAIRAALDAIPDRALQSHLMARLDAITTDYSGER